MSRVLAIGWELPEYSPGARMEAANYRTWQLTEPLLDDGHTVCLVAGRVGIDFPAEASSATTSRGFTYLPFRFSRPFWTRRLQDIHDEFRPDCIIGVTFLGALRATRLRSNAPLWFDIYGDQMAEMQAAARVRQSDRGIATQIRFFQDILRSGDVFSTCGGAQRYAFLGQLGIAGRLNRATFGYEFVYVVPPGAKQTSPAVPIGAIRGKIVSPASHVALWCGGYNTWTDVDTLFRGLELAMAGDPDLHFVSVGGALPGCDSYDQFVEMVLRSEFAERFHLLGWQPVSEIPGYYADADLGISLDAACYEAELGTRTRLVEMMQHGLPIVTTLSCELSRAVHDKALGATFAIGDWRTMGQLILMLSLDDERRRHAGDRALRYVETVLSLKASTEPLRSWVANPSHAPDRISKESGEVYRWQYTTRTMLRRALWGVAGLDQ